MTREQFQALIDSHGADWRHWPETVRESARAYVDQQPEASQTMLDDGRWLDQLLDSAPRPVVSRDLRDRVIADATEITARRGFRPGAFILGHVRLALGAGWAVAACAGVVAGVLLSSQLSANMQADSILYQASLDGADDLEILG